MDETHDARRNIETARDRMSDIAEELMFRSSPAYLKSRAKEAAVRKTAQTRDRMQITLKENPTAWKVIGGALGVSLASMLSKRFQNRDFERRYIGYYRGPYGRDVYGREITPSDIYGRDMGERTEARGQISERLSETREAAQEKLAGTREAAQEKLAETRDTAQEKLAETRDTVQEKLVETRDTVQEKLGHAKEVAQEKFGHAKYVASDRAHDVRERFEGIRERIPSSEELRYRAQDTWHRRVQSDPVPILLGAIALGALASFLLPVSDRERELTGPTRDKMRNRLGELKAQATRRLEQVKGQTEDTLSSFKEQATETLTGQQGEQQPLTYGLPDAYNKNLPH